MQLRRDENRVTVAGEVDVDTAPRLTTALLAAVRTAQHVVVDLTAVTFMDSQGLAALVRARREAEARGGTVSLTGVTPRIRKLLRITGLDVAFPEPEAPGTAESCRCG